MAYQILFTPQVARQIRKLPGKIQGQVMRRIRGLGDDPRPSGLEPVSTLENYYRIRQGKHRVVYKVDDERELVIVAKIANRDEVYKRLITLEKSVILTIKNTLE